MKHSGLILDLNGPFMLFDNDGDEIKITSARCKAIIAVLATSPKHKKSREWLKTALWPRSAEPQSSYSLRNALSSLRQLNEMVDGVVCADRSCVWLENIQTVAPKAGSRFTIFEDAPALGDEFEDWLRDIRLQSSEKTPALPKDEAAIVSDLPVIAINVPQIISDNLHAELVGSTICDQLVSSIRVQDVAAVLDLRDLISNQISNHRIGAHMAMALVSLKLIQTGELTRLSISVSDPSSGRIFWNSTLAVDQNSTFALLSHQIEEFTCMATDAILNALAKQSVKTHLKPSLITSIHQIMSMSPAGQISAREGLSISDALNSSAVANAWYAISIANSIGERGQFVDASLLEEAWMHCARAQELDRSNPIVLILVSHVYGFLFNKIELASELAKRARKLGNFSPLVWDLSAMNAIYRNAADEALDYSAKAARLSNYSPYRQFFLSSMAISASIAGKHEKAISVGKQVLTHMPDFLAVQRHLAASLVKVGELEEARILTEKVRERDATFNITDIRSGHAALPATASKELIESALKKIGD